MPCALLTGTLIYHPQWVLESCCPLFLVTPGWGEPDSVTHSQLVPLRSSSQDSRSLVFSERRMGDVLEKAMATCSSVAGESQGAGSLVGCVCKCKSDTTGRRLSSSMGDKQIFLLLQLPFRMALLALKTSALICFGKARPPLSLFLIVSMKRVPQWILNFSCPVQSCQLEPQSTAHVQELV